MISVQPTKGIILPAIILLFSIFTSSVCAFEMGSLSSAIKAGLFGSWRVSFEFGAVVMDNPKGDGLTRQYVLQPEEGDRAKRTVSVDVALYSNDTRAYAGLLYGHTPTAKSYHVFAVGSNGSPALLKFNNGRFRIVKSFKRKGRQSVRLGIVESTGEARFLVNGEEKLVVDLPEQSAGVGIIAISKGRSQFKNFDVVVAGKSKRNRPVKSTQIKPPKQEKPTASGEGQPTNILGQNGLPKDTYRVKPIQIVDEWGIEKGTVTAARLVIPEGWKFSGEKVVWVHEGCLERTIQSPFEVKSPDGEVIIAKFVTQQVLWTNFPAYRPACPSVRITNADEMVNYFVGLIEFENARLVEKLRIPELVEFQRQFYRGDAHGGALYMDHMAFVVDYEREGRPYRAGMFFVSNHNVILMNDGWGESFESVSTVATPQFMSAPREKFDQFLPIYQMVMNSYRVDPTWQAKVNRLFAKMRQSDRETFIAINKINSDSQKEIAAINQSIYDTKNQSSDQTHKNFIDAVREEQTVKTSTGPVITPAGSVWETGDGTLIISNNPAFAPTDLGITATKLPVINR